jgi:beta-lactamase regulating signal transducer with metallopeptidase domain
MDVLLNWVIQGVLVASGAGVGLGVMPASPAAARYRFVWTAYVLVLALPTLALVSREAAGLPEAARGSIAADPAVAVPAVWWTSPALLTGLWIVWSTVRGIQLVAGAVAVRRARRDARPCPRDVLVRLPHWSRVNGTGRPTRVVLSNDVRCAAVLGCGSPIIGIAPGLVDQLSVADLDRVLVHEWAHVQRRDEVTQVAQRIVRVLVGWHPAAWWLERHLDLEREAACDEVAVEVTGSRRGYASCLTTLATLRQPPSVRPLSAPAAASPGGLRRRVLRVLALPALAARPSRAVAVGAATTLAALAVAVATVRAAGPAPTGRALPIPARPPVAEMAAIKVPTAPVAVARWGSPRSMASALGRSSGRGRPAEGAAEDTAADAGSPPEGAGIPAIAEPSPVTLSSAASDSMQWTAGAPVSTLIARPTPGAAGQAATSLAADTPRGEAEDGPPPWGAAADAGVAVGRSAQHAGVETAGFFIRFGQRIARSF